MIRKNDDRTIKTRDAMREGPGSVIIKDAASKEEMYDKARMFAQLTFKENCGIGVHKHEGEKEIFIVNKGKAIYNDDGKEYEIGVGDVTICEDGHSHGITNVFKEECEVTALIILNN